jgi:hypothetical protein
MFTSSSCRSLYHLQGKTSVRAHPPIEMSSRAARKRVQPLSMGASPSAFFRKPNASPHHHSSRKRTKVSKDTGSGGQPPSTHTASSLFTFTQGLATTLPAATGASDAGTYPDANPPGNEYDAPALGGNNDDGNTNRARAGKVFKTVEDSAACSLKHNKGSEPNA